LNQILAVFLFGHDLLGEPVSTFPDHAHHSDERTTEPARQIPVPGANRITPSLQ
jgi:hypothetical protein